VEIVLKLAPSHIESARELLTDHVEKEFPASDAKIDPVFPGLTQGNRAGLFTIKLPGRVSQQALDRLLRQLRADAAIEYAELPARKQTMSAQT
jgi:hypothetical protein